MTSPSVSFEKAPTSGSRLPWLVPTFSRLIGSNISLMVKARMRGIRVKFIFGTSLMENEVSRAIYVDFLPRALAEGRYVAAPDPLVMGRGSTAFRRRSTLRRKAFLPRRWSSQCERNYSCRAGQLLS